MVFGTSGHRSSSLDHAFNEAHILAITQVICLYRKQQRIDGPLFLGIDTHALSEPAFATSGRVFSSQQPFELPASRLVRSPRSEIMRMNSPTGKKILSIVRRGDYAHPGEEEAIDLAMSGFQPDGERLILDVGCGRGGTAHYLQDRGWGNVVGFDIDEVSIEYARATYPKVRFLVCDIYEASARLTQQFDLISLFTTFYALPDQPAALRELRRVAAPHGSLVVFDYLDLSEDGNTLPIREEEGACWNPIKLKGISQLFAPADWKIIMVADISAKFGDWYSDLLSRIEKRQDQIVHMEGRAWYRFVHDFYGGMLASIKRGILGGVLVTARGV